jgi:hypothetical protein
LRAREPGRHRAAPVPMTRQRPLRADPIGLAVVERYAGGGVRRSKINISYPLTARRRAAIARTARADERARKLAPIIKAIRAEGITSLSGIAAALKKKSQMTSEEFKTALREAGFGVAQGWIVDVSGQCPGFATFPSFNKGVVNRNATLSKVIWERDAEIKRRAAAEAGRG